MARGVGEGDRGESISGDALPFSLWILEFHDGNFY